MAIKVRALDNCNPNTLKPSDWLQLYISRSVLKLTSGGAASISIPCGDLNARIITVENAQCFITSYVWNPT